MILRLITTKINAVQYNSCVRCRLRPQIMAQIESECVEIRQHLDQTQGQMDQAALQEEIGDLLHAAFSLCVFCKLSPQDTLERAIHKFENRLNAVKNVAKEQGFDNLNGFSFNQLMEIWQKAKDRMSAVQPDQTL